MAPLEAASSAVVPPTDVPRGLRCLLPRKRVNRRRAMLLTFANIGDGKLANARWSAVAIP